MDEARRYGSRHGRWNPIAPREVDGLNDAVKPLLPGMLAGPEKIREAAVAIAAELGVKELAPELQSLLSSETTPEALRGAAFEALAELTDDLPALIDSGLKDRHDPVRLAAINLLVKRSPEQALPALRDQLTNGTTAGHQLALKLLGGIQSEEAEKLLLAEFQRLHDGQLPAAVHLDLLDAAQSLRTSELLVAVNEFRRRQDEQGTILAKWSECLEGGNAERGREIFFGRSAASCRRCHKINSSGGEVGPDLTKTGQEKDRAYLLEAIVDPMRKSPKALRPS